ncbi:hypothetical protein HHI36_000869 [Cryptolaemus montrouzieri]|uniref:Uncharacterized protein n=1 Tax=Cryptolaemus montrouzieri TaxID=559131 RepID=A0ABD2P6M2_9CUCU
MDETSDIEEVTNNSDSVDDYVPQNIEKNEYSGIEDIVKRELIEQEEIHSDKQYSGEEKEKQVEIASMAVDSNMALVKILCELKVVYTNLPNRCQKVKRLFFTDEMCEIAVRGTNRKVVTLIQSIKAENLTGKSKVWKPLTLQELRAYKGILVTIIKNKYCVLRNFT